MDLSKTDYDDLEMLINIVLSIYHNFQRLCDLEIKGKKDTNEYQEYTEEIKRDIIFKDNFFERLSDTPEKCLAIIEYLKKEKFKDSQFSKSPIYSFIIVISKVSENEVILSYLVNQFIKKVLDNRDFIIKQEKEVILPEELLKYQKDFYSFQNIYQFFLMTDMYNLILALNERRINTANNQIIKNYAIRMKYQLGFLVPDMMNTLINQNFNASLNPFLINNNANKIYPVPERVETLIKRNFLLKQAQKSFNILPWLGDDDLINPEIMSYALNVQDMLRSILILADKETEEKIVKIIATYLEFVEEETKLDNKKMFKKILEDIIVNIKDDKSIPQIISFRRI